MTIDRTQALQYVNHGALAKMLVELCDEGLQVNSLLLLSPSADDHRCMRALFPRARIAASFLSDWNLNEPPPQRYPQVDLVVASNVMMYAPEPARWVGHALDIARVFAFQDLRYRRRAAAVPYFGDDGDCRRYSRTAASGPQELFALRSLPWPLEKYREFTGVANAYHPTGDDAVHICAAFRRGPAGASGDSKSPGALFFSWQSFPLARARHLLAKRLLHR